MDLEIEKKLPLYILVGGFNPSEKYWSNGNIIPNIWKKNVPNHQPVYIYLYLDKRTLHRPRLRRYS